LLLIEGLSMRLGVAVGCVVLLSAASLRAAEPSRVQVVSTFTSTLKADVHTKAGAPDTGGAVGPSHVIEMINGVFKIYDKRTGKLVLGETGQEFWDAALGLTFGPNTDNKDPRMVFDAQAGRWYASAQRDLGGNSGLTLARSETSDPTKGWKGVAFTVEAEPRPGEMADFDRLGFDADGIYVTTNHMGLRNKRPFLDGVGVYAIKKSDFNKATPVLTIARFEHVADARDIVPVIDHDGKTRHATYWGVSMGKVTTNDLLARIDLSGDRATWTLDRTTTVVGDKPGQLLQRTVYAPVSVAQPDGKPLFTNGPQHSAVHLVNGEFWQAHTVAVTADRKRVGVRWWRIRAADNTVLGEGLLSDADIDLTLASLSVDGRGNIVIACAGMSANQHPSIYVISGRLVGGKVVFDPSFTLVKAGEGDSTGGGRWGDFTTTVADPTAPGHFWLFQPWAQANGDWATQITHVRVADVK
jgi:hypothetical protein